MPKLDLRQARRMKNSLGEIRGFKVPNLTWVKPPLVDHYGTGVGQIGLHLTSDNAILDGNGRATNFINKGGYGSTYNANIVGNSLVLNSDNTYSITNTSGVPRIANRFDIMNKRFMFVILMDNLLTNDRIFGGADASNFRYELQHVAAADNRRRFRAWSNSTGGGNSTNQAWEFLPTVGLHIIEVELTNNIIRTWLDGIERNSGTTVWANMAFFLEYVGAYWNGTTPVNANFGDIIAVNLGTGSVDAIRDARAYLADRHSIVM